jgi:signal transduction histidine kinase
MRLEPDVLRGLLRAGGWGFLVAVALLGIPITIRVAMGVFEPRVGVVLMVELLVLIAVPLVAMVASFVTFLRRGQALMGAMVRSTLVTLPLAVGLSLGLEWLETRFPELSTASAAFASGFSTSVIISLSDSLPMLAAIAGVFFFPAAMRLMRERSEALERDVERLELARLRRHLEPHFVLNTLNAIAGLTTEAPEQARELLATLGDLLRTANDAPATRTVKDEVDWLRRYVRVFELRFPEQLRVSWTVATQLEDRMVPSLLWQPLVENALHHGALKAVGGGHLAITLSDVGGRVQFEVRDNGPGPGPRRVGGQGLSLVDRRLQLAGASPLRLERVDTQTVATVVT